MLSGKKRSCSLVKAILFVMAVVLVGTPVLMLYGIHKEKQIIVDKNSIRSSLRTPYSLVRLNGSSNFLPGKTTQMLPETPISTNPPSKPAAEALLPQFGELIQALFDEAVSNPTELLRRLEQDDPLRIHEGPQKFERLRTKDSSGNENHIDLNSNPYPRWADDTSIVNTTALDLFRSGAKESFLYYQHLRKAGGTGFCDMARTNMPRGSVPPYYCMPDNKGSLATPPWRDRSFLLQQLQKKGHRIAANEWDCFYSEHAQIPGVVLATTFRHPIDRWYSQYRFEHLEHRDGSTPDAPRNPFVKWYNNNKGWTMGTNYYVKTFVGERDTTVPRNCAGDFYWTYHKYQRRPVTFSMFLQAVQNLRKFHLILVTEWLSSSAPVIQSVLRWKVPPRQVLPHEVQAIRANKTSTRARDIVPVQDYEFMLTENAVDMLFFTVACRIFLERAAAIARSAGEKLSGTKCDKEADFVVQQ